MDRVKWNSPKMLQVVLGGKELFCNFWMFKIWSIDQDVGCFKAHSLDPFYSVCYPWVKCFRTAMLTIIAMPMTCSYIYQFPQMTAVELILIKLTFISHSLLLSETTSTDCRVGCSKQNWRSLLLSLVDLIVTDHVLTRTKRSEHITPFLKTYTGCQSAVE